MLRSFTLFPHSTALSSSFSHTSRPPSRLVVAPVLRQPACTVHTPRRPACPFLAEHDRSVLHCLALLLQVHAAPDDPLPGLATRRAHLLLRHGRLGLRSAAAHAPACWDSLRAIRARESDFCDHILQQLAGPACNIRCLASLQRAAVVLTTTMVLLCRRGVSFSLNHRLRPKPIPRCTSQPTSRGVGRDQLPRLWTTLSLQISPQRLVRRAFHCSTPTASRCCLLPLWHSS